MSDLLHQLAGYHTFRAMVIGDFMLDVVVSGAAERLSPDAPVPVLQASRTEYQPGGAANVAVCLRAIEGDVLCLGVVGDDPEAERLRTALSATGCDVEGLITDVDRPTTIKQSLVGLAQHRHPQKMFRVDVESREPLPHSAHEALLDMVRAHIDDVDVVCLEDYDKGVCGTDVCRAVIDLCRTAGKPVLIDPAAIDDYAKYRGATAITPNRSEAERATGLDTPRDASELHNSDLATRLLNDLDLDAVVLTLDRHGALLELRGEKPIVVPTVARSVYDVTGAGDMVLAALAGAVANGIEWLDAVRFANAAAGLEVEHFGAHPIPFVQIQREILRQSRRIDGKARELDELLVEVAVHRDAGHRVVLTNGCFDVIHAGHVAYLREAKKLGQALIVGVNSDEQVHALKGDGRPVYSARERVEILSELQCVDYVIVFHEPTAHDLIRSIQPDIYAKGGDYAPTEINEYDLAQELGIELAILAHRPGLGSTQVIERIRSSES